MFQIITTYKLPKIENYKTQVPLQYEIGLSWINKMKNTVEDRNMISSWNS